MLGVDLGELLYKMVCGLHGPNNSKRAAEPQGNHEEYIRVGVPTKALYVPFDIRASYHNRTTNKRGEASCSLHYLFSRNYGSEGFCSTHTFASVNDSPFAKLSEIKRWEFLSSHDSCWRDAARDKAWAVERELYEIATWRAGVKEKPIPYSDLHWMVSFPLFNKNFYQWVDVRLSNDPSDKHRYDMLVEIINEEKHEQTESSGA